MNYREEKMKTILKSHMSKLELSDTGCLHNCMSSRRLYSFKSVWKTIIDELTTRQTKKQTKNKRYIGLETVLYAQHLK